MPIWDNSYLSALLSDAEDYIYSAVNCIYDRFGLAIIEGQSVYTLQTYVKHIVRITYKGKKLYPLTFQDFCVLNPASAVVSETYKVESANSTPLYYVKHPTNFYDIRLYPTPSETIAAPTTNLFGSNISSGCIVSCYRTSDNTISYLQLPRYLIRHIKKAYVLWKAFAQEGKGQDIEASVYYKAKLDFLLETLKEINTNVFLGKQHRLGDTFNIGQFVTPARPVLPPDYEMR